jgi:REP element-mobilizing transposase RayT
MPQSFTCLLYHLVFSAKERRPWLTKDIRDRLYPYMGGILRTQNGVALSIGGTEDHIHSLARIHQTLAVADLLRDVKAGSSKWVHDSFPEMRDFAWQGGYGAFTVSASQINRLKTYIEAQEEHHGKEDFKTEFVRLLKAHDIEYDERYIWD